MADLGPLAGDLKERTLLCAAMTRPSATAGIWASLALFFRSSYRDLRTGYRQANRGNIRNCNSFRAPGDEMASSAGPALVVTMDGPHRRVMRRDAPQRAKLFKHVPPPGVQRTVCASRESSP